MNELTVLRVTALKGRVDADAVATSLGLDLDVVGGVLESLVAAGYLKQLPSAVRVTPEGRAHLAELLEAERADVDSAAMVSLYDEFCALNAPAKQIFTDWQMKDAATPNDHGDPEYDAEVLDRLTEIHVAAVPLVERCAAVAPRLERYGVRLADAHAKYVAGDHAWVTKPIIDSYHTVWFELHEDLIGLSGLTRADEAAAGRAH